MGAHNPKPEIILDLSRLLSRVLYTTPTGVDRCEMAYARGLLKAVPHRLHFAAVHPCGIYGRLSHDATIRFLDAIEQRWNSKAKSSVWEMRRFAIAALAAMRPRQPKRSASDMHTFYIQASHNNLTNPARLASILRQEQARLVCLVHDLIPLQYPEYAREGGAASHEMRMRTILRYAAGVVCNSQATLDALTPWMTRVDAHPETIVAHLGTHLHHMGAAAPSFFSTPADRPYFVCIGTIEPRKNHLLLLNLWRKMAEERGGDNIPKLIIVGRRGWENEQIVDMLDRCLALKECVEEQGRLSDREVAPLLLGSQALLMPSFAEGYGMPITEALALGVPVICSDLPALREAGGDLPTFLDPLDGPGWLDAIDQAANEHRSRTAAGPDGWQAPDWNDHIALLLKLLHRLSR